MNTLLRISSNFFYIVPVVILAASSYFRDFLLQTPMYLVAAGVATVALWFVGFRIVAFLKQKFGCKRLDAGSSEGCMAGDEDVSNGMYVFAFAAADSGIFVLPIGILLFGIGLVSVINKYAFGGVKVTLGQVGVWLAYFMLASIAIMVINLVVLVVARWWYKRNNPDV